MDYRLPLLSDYLIKKHHDVEKTVCQYDQQWNILEEISSKGKTEYH